MPVKEATLLTLNFHKIQTGELKITALSQRRRLAVEAVKQFILSWIGTHTNTDLFIRKLVIRKWQSNKTIEFQSLKRKHKPARWSVAKNNPNINYEKSSKNHQQHKHSGEIQFNEPRWSQAKTVSGYSCTHLDSCQSKQPCPQVQYPVGWVINN